MQNIKTKTFSAKEQNIQRDWYLIDAADKILGALAVKVANLLRGKNKVIYTPHCDSGDYVVIINAKKIKLSGKKETDKIYTRHTGYVGGQKIETPKTIRAKKPERLIEYAVKGMIPHNRLGRKILKKLKIYPDDQHPHQGQNPKKIEF